MKKLSLILALILMLSLLYSCDKDTPDEEPDTNDSGEQDTGSSETEDTREKFTVSVRTDDTFSVDGEDEVQVYDGDPVSFKLIFADNYKFQNATAGKFKDGVLTVDSVTKDLNIRVFTATVNPIRDFEVINNEDYGTVVSSAENGKITENSVVALVATPKSGRIFLGWTIGDTFVNGKEIVSESPAYDLTIKGNMKVYANYLGDGIKLVEYNLSGGYLAEDPEAEVYSKYHLTTYIESPNLIQNRDIIVREGHTLLGFSENPDGSGEFYTPGSIAKVPDSGKLTLYAQWSRWSDQSLFTTVAYNGGVKITGYSGDEAALSIPYYIGDSEVVSIAAGAINAAPFETLVIPHTVKSIDDGAFTGCASFDKLYITDSFDSIMDEAFENCRAYTKFYLGAYRNPNYVNTSESMAYRLNALYTRNTSKNMILVVGGSNVMHGFKAERMETTLLAGRYQVLNCGTNMNASGMIFLEGLKRYLKEGDIIVDAPEYGPSSEQFGGFKISNRLYRATECCFTLLSYVDASKYTGFLTSLTSFNQEMKTNPEGSYDKAITASTMPWCDMARETQNALPAGTPGIDGLGAGKILEEKAEATNAIAKEYEDLGVTFLFSYAPIFSSPDVTSDMLSEMDDRYRSLLNCPVISNISDYIFDEIFYFDSNYHLTTQGANRRTDLLYNDLKKYI